MNNPELSASSASLRYVSCIGWTHFFSEDGRDVERSTRWVYDREEEAILYLDIQRDQKWRASTLAEREDVADSLVNGNEGCLHRPRDWDFVESKDPPSWV